MNHTFTPASFGYAPQALWMIGLLVQSVAWLAGGTFYARYIGLSRWPSAALWVLSFVMAMVGLEVLFQRGRLAGQGVFHGFIFVTLFSMLAVPFVIRLYRKLVGGQLTDAEKLPGLDGVRAWLSPGNFICAIFIPVCAWQAFQVSLPAMLALTFGLLLVYPVFNQASIMPPAVTAGAAEDLSGEREKVLQLLEAGKITADESAELLNALGQSVPVRPQAAAMPVSPQRKLVLLGAVFLLVGFFLPWFSFNLDQLAQKTAAQVQQTMGAIMPVANIPRFGTSLSAGTVEIHAGDIKNGLGWWILTLGVGAAVLPFFSPRSRGARKRN